LKSNNEAPTKKLQNFSEEFKTKSNTFLDYIIHIPGFEQTSDPSKMFKSNSKLRPLIEGSEYLPPPLDIVEFDFQNDEKFFLFFLNSKTSACLQFKRKFSQ
jgi:hypothetical protein